MDYECRINDELNMRDIPIKNLPLPTIATKGPGLKYLAQNSSNDMKQMNTMQSPDEVNRSPKLSSQRKSLSLEEYDSKSGASVLTSPRSPRLRRLKLAHQSASLDGDLFKPVGIEPQAHRSRSPRPPGEHGGLSIKISHSSDNLSVSGFHSDATSQSHSGNISRSPRPKDGGITSLSIKISSDNLLTPETSKADISGSPPNASGGLHTRSLSPTPPRTPRDRSRSRSRSPYSFKRTGSNSWGTPSNSLARQDSEELAPWDFPNSLRCHPPTSPKPPRRLAPVKSLQESIKETSDLHRQTSLGSLKNIANSPALQKQTSSSSLKNTNLDKETDQTVTEFKHTDKSETDEEKEGVVEEFSEDEFDPQAFPINRRAELPHSSDIFQQALEALRRKGSRTSSRTSSASSTERDPGDLHVSRSSLVISQLSDHLDAENETPDQGLDTLEEDKEIPAFKVRDTWADAIKSVLDIVVEPRMRRKTTGSINNQQENADFQYGRRKGVVSSPTLDLLDVPAKHKPPKKFSSFSDAALLLCRSKSARRKVSQGSEPPISPKISMKAAFHLTKFITAACASDSVGGDSNKSTHLLSKGVSKLPQICNNGRMMQRQRRDSLRLARYMVEEESALGDATEVTSFDELKNCRYLRARPRSLNRKNSLLGYNEI